MATRVVDLGSVKGPQGPQGLAGPAGADGADGKDGMACRPARLVVGTSRTGWTAADCDYLCDGNRDEVEINAAIQALPAWGGEVVLLDGSYDVYDPVVVNKANVTLRGNGPATSVNCYLVLTHTIHITAQNCTVRDMRVYSDHDTAVVANGDCAAVLNCLLYGDESADCALSLSGSGSRIMGNLCQGPMGNMYVSGSGHVVMGNITTAAISSAAGCAVTGNAVIPWEEE